MVEPVFAACSSSPIDLGCNPPAITAAQAILAAGSVTDNCTLSGVSAVGGTISGTCVKTQDWTVTAIDACGNDAVCVVTYSWTADLVEPVFAACPSSTIDLGCNPPAITAAQAILSAGSVTDNCTLSSVSAVGGTITGTCVKTKYETVPVIKA